MDNIKRLWTYTATSVPYRNLSNGDWINSKRWCIPRKPRN